jgi:serine/threonine protein kinase
MATPPLLGDRYQLRGVLGRGGMGEIREGWDLRLQRAVAIKLLHPGFSADVDNRRRFQTEAHSAAALTHPNVVAIHDYGEHHGTPYIVMERLPGHNLADEIARGPVQQARVHVILDSVLSALAVAHAAGIVHRDIKPANILFTSDGAIKVADFGIAKTTANSYTQAGQIVGTLAYLTPERLAGRPADPTDDLYAVGCVGYESLTGRRPFPQEDLGALTRAILTDTPVPLMALCPFVAPPLASTIEHAMARDPRQRFASAGAMRSSLANPGPASPPTPSQRPSTVLLTAPVAESLPMGAYGSAKAAGSRRIAKRTAVAGIVGCLTLAVILLVANSPFDASTPATTSTSLPPAPLPSSTTTTTPTTTPTTPTTAEDRPGSGNHKGGHGRGNGRH